MIRHVSMETPRLHTLNLSLDDTLSESKKIIRANYGHFFALSVLFIPLSYSLITSPIFTLDHFHKYPHIYNHKALLSHLLYILIVYVFAVCAIATITYSTYHAFFGKQITFFASLKSLTFTFFPIISTAFVSHILLLVVSLSFFMLVGTNLIFVQVLGIVVIDYKSIYFMWFFKVICAALIVVIMYLHVTWSLAFVVVVVESKWGLEALIRSSYLVKGMRSVSLLLFLYYGFFCGISVWVISDSLHDFIDWEYKLFVIVLGSSMLMSYLLYSTSANTVLYNYCKAFHGELEIEGFTHEYVNLPSDDEKINVVTA